MGPLKKPTAAFVQKNANAGKRVLVAKPKKNVDYAALRKATMVRFSRTIAYLAK
jgi:hypothetical protein